MPASFPSPSPSPSPFPASSLKIAQAFNQAASTYNAHAYAQKDCAALLWCLFDRQVLNLPAGPLLEFGCGTGFLSQGLVERFGGQRSLEMTDLAPMMVQQCQLELQRLNLNLETSKFYALNAERMDNAESYALILSSFALQWFQHPQQSLEDLSRHLLPGGWLLLAFPSDRSFPQWHEQCANLGLPKPGNALPKAEPLIEVLRSKSRVCIVEEHWLPLEFERAIAFFQHFKAIGAATPIQFPAHRPQGRAAARLSAQQLRQLIQAWDQNSKSVRVDYHAVLVAAQVCEKLKI